MQKQNSIIYGYLDNRNRAIISVRLGNGEHFTGQVDTGFNGLFLFSAAQASEYGIGEPGKYDSMPGPGETPVLAGRVEGVMYFQFGQQYVGTVIVTAQPKPGSLARTPALPESRVLVGTRFLIGCQLSIRFIDDVKFPVRIIKVQRKPPKPVMF